MPKKISVKKTEAIVIIGGGIIGLSTALALGKQNTKVVVIDNNTEPNPPTKEYDPQLFAINNRSLQLLYFLGLSKNTIDSIELSSFDGVDLWCRDQQLLLKNSERQFFGKLIENKRLRWSLLQLCKQNSGIELVYNCNYKLENTSEAVTIAAKNSISSSNLIILADGSNSDNKFKLGIVSNTINCNQNSALCTTVSCDKPVGHKLYQNFGDNFTIALLPAQKIADNYGSIVWSTTNAKIQQLKKLTVAELQDEIAMHTQYRFGNILTIEKPAFFPLQRKISQSAVYKNVALIGDCLKTVHPLAGQGLNIGFTEIEELFSAMQKITAKPLELCLQEYNNRVLCNANSNQQIFEFINNFSQNNQVTTARIFKIINNSTLLKTQLIEQANNL